MGARLLSSLLLLSLGSASPAWGVMLLSETGPNAIGGYDEATGERIDDFLPAIPFSLSIPRSLVESPDGFFYSYSPSSASITRTDGASGTFLSLFGNTGGPGVVDLVLTPSGDLLALSPERVTRFAANGDLLGVVITNEGVRLPYGAAFGPDGSFYVVDDLNPGYDIYRYDDDVPGTLIGTFGSNAGPGRPRGLTFGPGGDFYVGDTSNTIFRFDGTTGQALGAFATGGGLFEPRSLTFGADGHLYVASYFTEQVLRYDGTTGAFIDVFVGGGALGRPAFIAFGSDGDLYVASDFSHAQVRRYDGATGADLGVFADGSTLGNVHTGLAFGPGGDLFATVSDGSQTLAVRYDGTTGAVLSSFPVVDSVNLVAGGADDRLFVSSVPFGGVQRYDADTGVPEGVFAAAELGSPTAMTQGPGGDLFIANGASNDVRRYDGSGFHFLGVFVSGGLGGPLDLPIDVQFGPDGNLYVAGQASRNVRVHDGTTGAFLQDISHPTIERPAEIVFGDDGLLYLVDEGLGPVNGRVLRFDVATGNLVDELITLPGTNQRAVDLVFSDLPGPLPGMEELADRSQPGLDGPEAVAAGPDGSVYVADFDEVLKIAPDGTVTQILDSAGSGTGFPMTGPHDVAVTPDGNVYVAAIWSDNVFRIDPAGVVTQVLDISGAGPGAPLEAPWYLATDADNNVYVTGNVSRNVIKLEPDGTKTELIDGSGDGSTDLFGPRGVSVDPAGNVFVAGWGRHNLFRITPGGVITLMADFGSGLNRPEDVQVDPFGSVFVVNTEGTSVMRVDAVTGDTIEMANAETTGGLMARPLRLAIAPSGNVLVSSSGSDNVVRLLGDGDVVEVIGRGGAGFGGNVIELRDVAVEGRRIITIGHQTDNVVRFTPARKRCGMGPELVPLLLGLLAVRRRARPGS